MIFFKRLLLPFGRITRRRFWATWAILFVIQGTVTRILKSEFIEMRSAGLPAPAWTSPDLALPLTLVVLTFWLNLVVFTNRMHDSGRSGLILLTILIPAVLSGLLVRWLNANQTVPALGDGSQPVQGLILAIGILLTVALYLVFILRCGLSRGDVGYNAYGRDPRE